MYFRNETNRQWWLFCLKRLSNNFIGLSRSYINYAIHASAPNSYNKVMVLPDTNAKQKKASFFLSALLILCLVLTKQKYFFTVKMFSSLWSSQTIAAFDKSSSLWTSSSGFVASCHIFVNRLHFYLMWPKQFSHQIRTKWLIELEWGWKRQLFLTCRFGS